MKERWSLISAFTPPEGWTGVAAILCSLSADAPVVEGILRAFTGEREQQRARRGTATALLIVDRRSNRSSLRTIPGLYVAEPILEAWTPDSMLHAKVALLGYARDPKSEIGFIRLVVSTGNWTVASLRRDIDMLWVADLDVIAPGQEQVRADINAAAELFKRLIHQEREGSACLQELPPLLRQEELISTARQYQGQRRPRFIHSMDISLLRQIGTRFKPDGGKWNWIHVGSGFYEQPTKVAPEVLPKIVGTLRSSFTATPTKLVTVNPGRAGALATSCPKDWKPCRPKASDNREFMHAKFIAAARKHAGRFSDVVVYLGSGNLSKAGLLSAFGQSKGHVRIEAGVVFRAGNHTEDVLRQLLPDWQELNGNEIADLAAGDPEEDMDTIPPPPVPFAWMISGGAGQTASLVLVKSTPETAAELQINSSIQLLPVGVTEVSAPGFMEPYLEVRVLGADQWTVVPVLGLDGSFARVRPQPGSIDDVLDALLAFPAMPSPADDETDGNPKPPAGVPRPRGARPPIQALSHPVQALSYPARDAMRLVEGLASLATEAAAVSEERVQALAEDARRILLEGFHDDDRGRLTDLGINFLAPLKEMPGMPATPAWMAFVDEVASKWKVLGKPALCLKPERSSTR